MSPTKANAPVTARQLCLCCLVFCSPIYIPNLFMFKEMIINNNIFCVARTRSLDKLTENRSVCVSVMYQVVMKSFYLLKHGQKIVFCLLLKQHYVCSMYRCQWPFWTLIAWQPTSLTSFPKSLCTHVRQGRAAELILTANFDLVLKTTKTNRFY